MTSEPDDLRARLVAEIRANGPMPFDDFVERVLYDQDAGFYATIGRAGGRRGDFVTSVEVGPLFGAVIADWLDEQWYELERPEPYLVAEVGAGVGTLYRTIHRAGPACLEALHYTLVERSVAQRAVHADLPAADRTTSAAVLPSERQHVIMANELLDNLGFGIAERADRGWSPVQVEVDGGRLDLRAAAEPSPALNRLSELAPDAQPGDRVPVAVEAGHWVEHAVDRADRVLVFDYGATTAELARRGVDGWLRTYAEHRRGGDPLADPGGHDITHDVPFDQLPPPDDVRTQADWLRANGLDERVAAAKRTWNERAHIGDLQAMVARSAVGEAEALTDPTGLGGFTALTWRSPPS